MLLLSPIFVHWRHTEGHTSVLDYILSFSFSLFFVIFFQISVRHFEYLMRCDFLQNSYSSDPRWDKYILKFSSKSVDIYFLFCFCHIFPHFSPPFWIFNEMRFSSKLLYPWPALKQKHSEIFIEIGQYLP